MKILFIADLPQFVLGGRERQYEILLNGLQRKGCKVFVFGAKVNKGNIQYPDGNVQCKRIRVLYKSGRFLKGLTYFLSLTFLLVKHKKDYDVIYTRNFADTVIVVSFLKNIKLIKCPFVVSLSSIETANNTGTGFIKSLPFSSNIVRLINKNTNYINAINKEIKCNLLKLGINNNKISEIPNGVPLFSRKNYVKSSNKSFVLIYTGRFESEKNLFNLIAAIKKLEHVLAIKLLLVGDGSLKEKLYSSVIKLGIQNKVFIVNTLPNKEVIKLLNKCDAFVLPSFYEGVSNSLLEAMSCSLPIIVTEKCGVIDDIRNHAFICDPHDVDSISKNIFNLYQMSINERRVLGACLKKIIVEKYSSEHVSNLYYRMFKKLID